MRRLLIDCARVGDLVMLTPIVRHLAKDADLDLLTRPWGRPLLGGQPGVGQLFTLANPNRGRAGLGRLLYGGERRRLAPVLAARGYHEVVLFRGESSVVKEWVDGWKGAAQVRIITRRGEGAARHAVDANVDALRYGNFSVDGYDPLPGLTVPPARLAAARARLAPLGTKVAAVQAGSSFTHSWFRKHPNLKGLTSRQWAEFLSRLLRAGDLDAVVLHGSKPEGREARAIMGLVAPDLRPRLHDWTGQVPLDELPAVLAVSHATISLDTGPAHIAAAVGCPLMVLFGPTDPAEFLPRGPGAIELMLGSAPCQFCHGTKLYKRCRDNVCLNTLSTETLVASWKRLLAQVESRRSAVPVAQQNETN
jgi:ADP-heptose:LPS heptosyltransferase